MNPSFLFLPKCSSQTNKSCPGRRGEVWRRGHQHACLISLFGPPLFELPLFLGHYYFWDVTLIESFETFLGHQLNNQNTCKTSSSRLCNLKTIQPSDIQFSLMLLNFEWCCSISLSKKRGGGKFSWLPRVCLVLLRRSQGRRLQPLNFSSSRLGFLRCVCLHISAHSQMHSTQIK